MKQSCAFGFITTLFSALCSGTGAMVASFSELDSFLSISGRIIAVLAGFMTFVVGWRTLRLRELEIRNKVEEAIRVDRQIDLCMATECEQAKLARAECPLRNKLKAMK